MKIRAFAKINLALDVIRKREDGYHDLEMVMAPITLHDLIFIDLCDEGISMTCNSYKVPTNDRNVMMKAAKYMFEKYQLPGGVKMHVYKHIPSQAGLGGGSADGAAVIRGISRLFGLKLSFEEMAHIGKNIGADIPFCIYNRISFVQGIGEVIEPIKTNYHTHLLLVKPKKGVSTKKCFESLNIEEANHPDIPLMIKSLEENNHEGVIQSLGNTLETPSLEFVEDIRIIKEEMKELGFDGVLMSGSGSCVFGMTKDESLVDKGVEYFRKKYPFVRKTELL